MDGMSHAFALPAAAHGPVWDIASLFPVQRSLRNAIGCVGVGLHSGRRVAMTLHPSPAGTGIVFRRLDIPGSADIPARFDRVVDTRLCTVLANPSEPEARVGTTEHLLAALAGCGVHNALVTLDGPEVPILDGSSANFVFLIDCAGMVELDAPLTGIEVLRPVRVRRDDASAELLPGGPGLDITMSIDFDAPAIGTQSLSIAVSPDSFRGALARARTFTLADEVAALRHAGLALGGSLDNAIVVDDSRVLNPGGLRMRDEFVRHKVLDAVGDLSLAGAPLHGRFVGRRSGHALNNQLLRALFSDDANWAPIAEGAAPAAVLAGWSGYRLPAAAAPAR